MSRFFYRAGLAACGVIASFAPVLFAQTASETQPASDTVRLDRYDVVAEQERAFSLTLDSAPSTGSRLGLNNRDLPVSVAVIPQEMMQMRGLRTAVEAVEMAVGMTGGTQFGSIPSYSTRGFGGNSVTIMRDGIRQNTASQSSRTVDSFLLDRVEILKGPASLMFGEGAVGGAVNYVSKSASLKEQGEFVASAGAWDSYRFGMGWGGPVSLGKGRAPLATRFDYTHSQTAGYVDRSAERYDGFAGAISWQASPALKLSLNTTLLKDWNESYYGNPVVYDGVVNTTIANGPVEVRTYNNATDRMVNPRVLGSARKTNYNILDNYAKTENTFTRLRAEAEVTPDLELRNEAYVSTQLLKWRNLETNVWNPVSQLVTRSSFVHIYRDDVLTGNRLDAIYKGDLAGLSNRLIVGGLFERSNMIRGGTPAGYATTASSVTLVSPVETNGPGDGNRFLKTSRVNVRTAALYAEDVLKFTPRLSLVTGLRWDDIELRRDVLATSIATASTYGKGYSPWTGRVGLVWGVTKDLNLYASYSRAAEPTTQLVSFTSTSNDFSLQTGKQYEVGAKGTFLDKRLDVTLALYEIEKNNILASTLDQTTGLRISQQIGSQKSRGVEWASSYLLGAGWRVTGNLAYTEAWYGSYAENLGTGVIDRTGNTPSNIPEWVANLFLVKSFANGLAVDGGVRYVSDRFANTNNSTVAEAYTVVDAGLSYAWKNCKVTLRGRNLTDEEYQPIAGSTMWRLAEPRNAEITFRYQY